MGDRSGLRALALATQLGFAIAGPLVVFVGGGAWLDAQLHTRPWLFMLGLLLGLLSAGAALWQIAVVGSQKNTSTTARRTRTRIDTEDGDAGTNHANDKRLNGP